MFEFVAPLLKKTYNFEGVDEEEMQNYQFEVLKYSPKIGIDLIKTMKQEEIQQNDEIKRQKEEIKFLQAKVHQLEQDITTLKCFKGNCELNLSSFENEIKVFEAEDFEQPNYSNRIGCGAFGEVYKLKCEKDNNYYGVKIIHNEFNEELKTKLQSEITILSKLSYPSLIKLHGITLAYPYFIITDFIPNHSVQYFINKASTDEPQDGWNMTNKFIIIFGIALGMRYMHSMNIIHRDLKPDNVLLESNFYPKICDFGVSQIYSSAQRINVSTGAGTTEFCGPEVYNASSDNEYDGKKADIFSFGITLYSIIYDSIPFAEVTNKHRIPLEIINGHRPELKNKDFQSINELINQCWQQKPYKRPDFEEIIHILFGIKAIYAESGIIDETMVNNYIKFCDSGEIRDFDQISK